MVLYGHSGNHKSTELTYTEISCPLVRTAFFIKKFNNDNCSSDDKSATRRVAYQ